jgi:hypothetical protein
MPDKREKVYFDDALPKFVELVQELLGEGVFDRNAFLRDAEGNLTFILRDELDENQLGHLREQASIRLGTYTSEFSVATARELFDESLEDPTRDQWEGVNVGGEFQFVRLVERRILGQDWLRRIEPKMQGTPPIVVFASHKGGVGRSTALAVAAADLANRGKSVLSIDLDLEAPALGDIFLPRGEVPDFGALDYYVENGRGLADDEFLRSMLAVSPLTQGKGQVLAVPAVGKRSRAFPQNVIGKLSRAYLEDVSTEDAEVVTKSFLDQTRAMVGGLCRLTRFDVVFIDARAGLSETTAATVQGLGADVLLFGVDTPQTWEGYRYFLAHLARFKPEAGEDDWRYRLKMVHAKASPDPKAWGRFRDNAFELFADSLYDEADENDSEAFSFDLDDSEAPHFAFPILIDSSYFEFDPLSRRDQLAEPIYSRTFGAYLNGLAERLRF